MFSDHLVFLTQRRSERRKRIFEKNILQVSQHLNTGVSDRAFMSVFVMEIFD